MSEYEHDSEGFYRTETFARTGEKARPIDVVQGTVVFDSATEAAKRAENRAKVEQFTRTIGSRAANNPYHRKMR